MVRQCRNLSRILTYVLLIFGNDWNVHSADTYSPATAYRFSHSALTATPRWGRVGGGPSLNLYFHLWHDCHKRSPKKLAKHEPKKKKNNVGKRAARTREHHDVE